MPTTTDSVMGRLLYANLNLHLHNCVPKLSKMPLSYATYAGLSSVSTSKNQNKDISAFIGIYPQDLRKTEAILLRSGSNIATSVQSSEPCTPVHTCLPKDS